MAAPTSSTAASEIPERLWASFKKAHKGRADATSIAALETFLGRTLPPDLSICGFQDNNERTIFLRSVKKLVSSSKNSFAHIVESTDSQNTEPLVQVFINCYRLPFETEQGAAIFAHIPSEIGRTAQACAFDDGSFLRPFTNDLPTFEILWGVFNDAQVSAKEAATRLKQIRERYAHAWPINASHVAHAKLLEKNGGPKITSSMGLFLHRSAWIISALCEGRVRESFIPQDQSNFQPTAALKSDAFPRRVPTALYWLWRAYLLKEDDRTETILRRLDGTPSRLLADAAKLVEEFRAGRNEFAEIRDIRALRDELFDAVHDREGFQKRRIRAQSDGDARAIAPLAKGPIKVRRLTDSSIQPAATEEDGTKTWQAPDGTRFELDDRGLRYRAAGAKKAVTFKTPWSGSDIETFSPRSDFTSALIGASKDSVEWFGEIEIPAGKLHFFWPGLAGATVTHAAHNRIVACETSSGCGITVLERRGPQFVPSAVLDASPRIMRAVCNGTILIFGSDGGNTRDVAIYANTRHRLVELSRAPVQIRDVATDGNRVFLITSQDDRFELEHLKEAYEEAEKASKPTPLDLGNALEVLKEDPRPSALATAADTRLFPEAARIFRVGGIPFAIFETGGKWKLSWRKGEKTVSCALPRLAASYGQTADDEMLQVRVSPSGEHAVFFRLDALWVCEVDLATGKIVGARENDSQFVLDATYVSESAYAVASWNWELYRRGLDEPHTDGEAPFGSIAGAPLEDGRHLIAGVKRADADGGQELHVLEMGGVDEGERTYEWWEPLPLTEELATVTRHANDILLLVRSGVYRIKKSTTTSR